MFLHRSFRYALPTSSLLCLPFFQTIYAQSGALSITNISTDTYVDLYQMYNRFRDTNDVVGVGALFFWKLSDERGLFDDISSTYNSSLELMEGPAEEASNDVIDVVDTNAPLKTFDYFYPASLPQRLYHARINTTVNTTRLGQSRIQQLTARTPTINVTTSSQIGCGRKEPLPFETVTSPSDSRFTSIRITHPSAGFNVIRSPDANLTDRDVLNIRWVYRDWRNSFGDGISDITVQILDSTTSEPVGPLLKTRSHWRMDVKFTDVPMKLNGSYRIQLRYRNTFPDGAVQPGGVVTLTSGDFNIILEKDLRSNCGDRDPAPNSPSSNSSPSRLKGSSNWKFNSLYHGVTSVGCLAIVNYFL